MHELLCDSLITSLKCVPRRENAFSKSMSYMWRLSKFLLPVAPPCTFPSGPHIVVMKRCYWKVCSVLCWCAGWPGVLKFVTWEIDFRVIALSLWKLGQLSAGFQWLCECYKMVPISIFISPGSRQENRNHLKNSKQVAFTMEKCLYRCLRLEEQKGDHKIKSEIPNCRKWLPVLELIEGRVRVDFYSSRALAARVPPEDGKREDRKDHTGGAAATGSGIL